MKKITKLVLLPLCTIALVACSSGSEIDYYKALDYSKKNYSVDAVLEKYQSVTYDRVVKEITAKPVKIDDEDEDDFKKQCLAILDNVKAYYGTTTAKETVVLNAVNVQSYFFGEAFLNQLNNTYSSPEIKPIYSISKKGMEATSTYSFAYPQKELELHGAKEGGIAVNVKIKCDTMGCVTETEGMTAVTIDVDGDKKADVEYTFSVSAKFTWNPKE